MDSIFGIESFDEFQSASQEVVNNLYCFENITTTHVEPSVLNAAKHDMKNIISNSNFDLQIIGETLLNKGWDQEKSKYFLTLLNNKKTQLLRSSLDHHNSSYGETLIDFDWLLKLILGTSELNTLQYPLLQLFLTTIISNGALSRSMLDVDKNVLLKIIDKLEKIVE